MEQIVLTPELLSDYCESFIAVGMVSGLFIALCGYFVLRDTIEIIFNLIDKYKNKKGGN